MSFGAPTLLPGSPQFPILLPQPPLHHPTPLPAYHSAPGGLKYRRNLNREMDDLSDEEDELDDLVCTRTLSTPDTTSLTGI